MTIVMILNHSVHCGASCIMAQTFTRGLQACIRVLERVYAYPYIVDAHTVNNLLPGSVT